MQSLHQRRPQDLASPGSKCMCVNVCVGVRVCVCMCKKLLHQRRPQDLASPGSKCMCVNVCVSVRVCVCVYAEFFTLWEKSSPTCLFALGAAWITLRRFRV